MYNVHITSKCVKITVKNIYSKCFKICYFLIFFSKVHTVIMDKTDEEILKNDPELANLFTDDEEDDAELDLESTPTFNFGRSRTGSTRRSQSAKLG